MRVTCALALAVGVTGVSSACSEGGDIGPSNTAPLAAFTPTCAFLACTLTGGSTDADGQITAYSWDFGDGAAVVTTKDAQHTFLGGGTYPVSLTVSDNDGAISSIAHSVEVSAAPNVPPTAGFTSACTDLTCSFTDMSRDEDGSVVGFHWDFGDGTTAESQNPTYAFASEGIYLVALTVTDDRGGRGAVAQPVTVTAAGPIITAQRSTVWVYHGGLCYPGTGGNRPCGPSGSLAIRSTGSGILNWTATKDVTWLTITPISGTTPSDMQVSVNGTGLPSGPTSGQITISAPGAASSPLTVTVQVNR